MKNLSLENEFDEMASSLVPETQSIVRAIHMYINKCHMYPTVSELIMETDLDRIVITRALNWLQNAGLVGEIYKTGEGYQYTLTVYGNSVAERLVK